MGDIDIGCELVVDYFITQCLTLFLFNSSNKVFV